jgi:hypothetical protein
MSYVGTLRGEVGPQKAFEVTTIALRLGHQFTFMRWGKQRVRGRCRTGVPVVGGKSPFTVTLLRTDFKKLVQEWGVAPDTVNAPITVSKPLLHEVVG